MEQVSFTTDDGIRLEGELRRADAEPRGSAVICHPHPRHGGSKDHPILWALRNELAGKRGVSVVAFNFRGVMGSAGTYGGGREELRDVGAAIDLARAEAPDRPTIVCGWSFGANVALREAVQDPRVRALVLIGIPLRPKDLSLPQLPSGSDLGDLSIPVLLVVGSQDEYCPPDDARAFAAELPRGDLHLVDGTDHYLWRREREAATVCGDFVDEVLSSSPPPTH